MGILDSAGDIGSILAAMEAARAKGRVDQGDMQQRQANAAANIYRTQSDVALKGPLQSAKAAAQGDQMANIQPFSWTGDTKQVGNLPVPQSTGGLTPANFGPSTRKAGSDLATLSANRVASPAFNVPKPPVLAPLPESNALDSILGAAGSIGSLAGAAGKSGGGGPIDIAKIIAAIRNRGTSTNGNTGQPTGDFTDNLNDPGNAFDPTDYGRPGDGNYGSPDANVDTSTTFNGIPGGFPNSPEDPLSADPEWWRQFVAGDQGGGGGDTSGSNWWSE